MKKCFLDYEGSRYIYDDCVFDDKEFYVEGDCLYADENGIKDKRNCKHWREDSTAVCSCCGQKLPEE